MTPLLTAAVQLIRSRIAAHHLLDLAPSSRPWRVESTTTPQLTSCTRILFADILLRYAYATRPSRVILDLLPGVQLAFTGASGAGKTTLLMTLASLLPLLRGQVLLDGIDIRQFNENQFNNTVSFFRRGSEHFRHHDSRQPSGRARQLPRRRTDRDISGSRPQRLTRQFAEGSINRVDRWRTGSLGGPAQEVAACSCGTLTCPNRAARRTHRTPRRD